MKPRDRVTMAMTTHEWGRRLSDRVRAALGRGDLATARRLVVEGDGETPSLEKEYALMYRTLGATVRVVFRLLGEAVARSRAPRAAARADAAALVHRFHVDLATLYDRSGIEARDAVERLGEAQAEIVLAIDTEHPARIRQLITAKEYGHYVPLHDRLVRFLAETFGWVLVRFGPETLLDFHRATAEAQRAVFERWERMTVPEFVRATVCLAKQHMGRVEVREDAEKFTIEQSPCGSGGRLLLSGAYAGPAALPFATGPGPLTLGERRLPVYCTQCAVWKGIKPLEWFGHPQAVVERPVYRHGSCIVHIYKRRNAAPPEYARRLGFAGRTSPD
ncbi:MAG: hypothetical protein HYU41_19615 [Candidatus Rokubacteria bacterium]|nr:hypothetical protein [Candidatus Rokubacteria bacterium]